MLWFVFPLHTQGRGLLQNQTPASTALRDATVPSIITQTAAVQDPAVPDTTARSAQIQVRFAVSIGGVELFAM